MLYDIRLTIRYSYEIPASNSRHLVRMAPADLPREQRLVASSMTIDPEPDESAYRDDFFGNRTAEFAFRAMHDALSFTVAARVERFDLTPQLQMSPLLQDLPQALLSRRDLGLRAPHHFVGASERVPLLPDTTRFAQELAGADRSVVDIVARIGGAIHDGFSYDPKATTVDTTVAEAFAARRGVCQDFAHVMIACLRGLGIPSGYVSGLLRTAPPPGKPRLEGADAMHAWVMAWCGPDLGWIEFDPTNNVFVGSDHIVVARGRDYFDVSPIKGMRRGYGNQSSKQLVDVIPVT